MHQITNSNPENSEIGCWNCLYEYICNWIPSGDNYKCKEWKTDCFPGKAEVE